MYKFSVKQGLLYPDSCFDSFECIKTGELATIIAESNSGKTTFAMDMISKNSDNGVKGYYINLEFPIETMRESRWLWLHGKTKRNLTGLAPLSEEEVKNLEDYVNRMLNKFDYFNSPNGISLQKLIQEIEVKAIQGYKFFVIDTFSRISGNLEKDSRGHQNECMEKLQEIAQRLDIAIIMLHHTNRSGTWEGSQKIMDLSNVFLVISKEVDAEGEEYRNYKLMKDKYVVSNEVDVYYHGGIYEKF